MPRRACSRSAEILDLDRPVGHDPQRRGSSRGRIVDAGRDVVRPGPVLLRDGVLAHDLGPRVRFENHVVSGDAYHAADGGDVPVVSAVQGYGMLLEIEGDDLNVDSRRHSLHAALDVSPEIP